VVVVEGPSYCLKHKNPLSHSAYKSCRLYSRTMKPGDLLEITFWDHSTNMAPVKCTVWGKVSNVTRMHVELSSWEVEHDDEEVKDDNREYVSILRKAIISSHPLKYK
jgi:hypothetical protein